MIWIICTICVLERYHTRKIKVSSDVCHKKNKMGLQSNKSLARIIQKYLWPYSICSLLSKANLIKYMFQTVRSPKKHIEKNCIFVLLIQRRRYFAILVSNCPVFFWLVTTLNTTTISKKKRRETYVPYSSVMLTGKNTQTSRRYR